jgi:hypothetical protein
MRCRPGDRAVIVSGENVGRLVDVIEESDCLFGPGWWFVAVLGAPAKGSFLHTGGTYEANFGNIEDRCLRPLRDSDGTDEVLRYAGHPLSQSHREKADA